MEAYGMENGVEITKTNKVYDDMIICIYGDIPILSLFLTHS